MKILNLIWILLLVSPAWALKLSYVGETSIKTGTKFEKTTIGGLSGMVFANDTLYALSDDKGRVNPPRFYEFDLKIAGSQVQMTPKAVRFITGLPKIGEKPATVDPEGLVLLNDGSFLISSEGNNDAKPREMPRIFQVSAEGLWMRDLKVPEKYLPETTGKQTVGIQNNAAFEGLTRSADGKTVWTALESALVQDFKEDDWEKGDFIRLLKYRAGSGFEPAQELVYHIDPFHSTTNTKEVFRGVSEILSVSENKMLVMERGARLVPEQKIYTNTVALYLADLTKASDVRREEKIIDVEFSKIDKVKLLDFETDLRKARGEKPVQNFEALAWGPNLPDGRRTLLVLSDNNFSKKEITELIVFAVEE